MSQDIDNILKLEHNSRMNTQQTSSYIASLAQSGLSYAQARVYEILLKNGPLKAGKVHQKSDLKRGLVYKVLEELVILGLVEKNETSGKVAVFEPQHPAKLKDLAEKQEEKAKTAQLVLDGIMSQMASEFNLAVGKPGVSFYEGLDGVKKVLDDTLNDNPQKYLEVFSDASGYSTYLLDWNTNYYAPKRKRLNIFEKVIVPNSPKALEWLKGYQANEVTDFLFVDHNTFPFHTEINIYNNKVSFVTFSAKTHIGVIVENKEIYETLKSIFNFVWQMGKQHLGPTQPPWIKNQPQITKQRAPLPAATPPLTPEVN